MSTATTFVASGVATPKLPFRSVPFSSKLLRSALPVEQRFKAWSWRVKCKFSEPNQDAESEAEATKSSLSSTSSSSTISAYKWCAGLGGLGFIETAYLTYLKLTNAEAFCPSGGGGGGGSCGDVLSSDYAVVFGVPLPLIGMVAYGLVSALSLQLSEKKLPFGASESDGRLVLLAITASMAAASGYFLYILSTRFSGISCSYCLASVFLSFSLSFLTLKDFGLQEMQKMLALQLCVASFVIITLNTSYSAIPPDYSSTGDINYFATEITTPSSPFALALAKHLRSIGAKMYGAFWCSHCIEQKQIFGKEAYKILDYVECFPDGYKKGTQVAKACADLKLEGFPMWVINGQVLSGEKELSELARVAEFKFAELTQAS